MKAIKTNKTCVGKENDEPNGYYIDPLQKESGSYSAKDNQRNMKRNRGQQGSKLVVYNSFILLLPILIR